MEKTLRIASYNTDEYDRLVNINAPKFYFGGVYLHGEIEDLCNHDLCRPINYEDFPDEIITISEPWGMIPYLFLEGVFPCVVDSKYECTAFLWYNHDNVKQHKIESYTMRGLIVLNTDKSNLEYAFEKYNKRSYIL